MHTWIEERVETARMALGIAEFPDGRGALELASWLADLVTVRTAPVDRGSCWHLEDSRARITLPDGLDGRELDATLAHELGHALLTAGIGALLRQEAPGDPRIERLARAWDLQDEERARYFVLAFYLPSRAVQVIPDDEELQARANVHRSLIYRRRQDLAGQWLDLRTAPRWSASLEFEVIPWAARWSTTLTVARRGTTSAVYEFPTTIRDLHRDAQQVQRDLLALTACEFAIRYELFRCAPPAPLPLDFRRLRTTTAAQR